MKKWIIISMFLIIATSVSANTLLGSNTTINTTKSNSSMTFTTEVIVDEVIVTNTSITLLNLTCSGSSIIQNITHDLENTKNDSTSTYCYIPPTTSSQPSSSPSYQKDEINVTLLIEKLKEHIEKRENIIWFKFLLWAVIALFMLVIVISTDVLKRYDKIGFGFQLGIIGISASILITLGFFLDRYFLGSEAINFIAFRWVIITLIIIFIIILIGFLIELMRHTPKKQKV